MSQISTGNSYNTTSVKRSGNVASLSQNLTAIDTHGNVFEVPDYSIKDILSAIPKHCYERRLTTSFYYVFRDVFSMAAIGYMANTFIPMIPSKTLRFVAYSAYCFVQGLIGTGIWILAHECGHGAFSDYKNVNDVVGWVLHSYLLVPYFSWKYTHSMHHKSTGNLSRDMVFVPKTKEEFLNSRATKDLDDILEDSPIYTLYCLVSQQLFGWIAHITTNVTGQRLPDVAFYNKNHFNPSSVLFDSNAYWYIVMSDIGILTQLFVLYNWYKTFGGFNLLINWFVPYLFVNHWLVFITYLQHSDPKLPHYEAEQWNFARGAATTIDRNFGFIGEHIFHDICETHVLHHYVSRIPFYNGREATEAIKQVMGKHYQASDENMWVSFWKTARWCQYIEGDNGVMMYRNINGKGIGTNLK